MAVQRASTCPKCARVFIEGELICPFDATPFAVATEPFGVDPLVGTVVNRSYVILAKLGEGGMGVVYKALQQRLGREVALKVLAPRFGADAKAAERFRGEARAVSQLTNPHTVTVFDFGTADDGTLYLAMQLLPGESLRERMKRAPLTPLEALSVTSDICESLEEAHEREPQIIHRDIKPDNIFVRTSKTGVLFATVLDFGLARFADSPSLTATNAVIGTVAYMSPEQARSEKQLDGRLDLYALGVMLFEMLTGSLPFESPEKMSVMYKHVYDAPPRLNEKRTGAPLPQSLETLVAELLAKSPSQRPESARVVRARIQEIRRELEGLPGLNVPSVVLPAVDFFSGQVTAPSKVRTLESESDATLVSSAVPGTGSKKPGALSTAQVMASAGLGHAPRRRWLWIAGVVAVALAVGVAYSLMDFGREAKPTVRSRKTAVETAVIPGTPPDRAVAPAPSAAQISAAPNSAGAAAIPANGPPPAVAAPAASAPAATAATVGAAQAPGDAAGQPTARERPRKRPTAAKAPAPDVDDEMRDFLRATSKKK